jgi:hypothetical protein
MPRSNRFSPTSSELDIPTMPELHAITPAPVPVAAPQRPSAQLADPLTFLDIIELQVQAFFSVLPLLKVIFNNRKYGAIQNEYRSGRSLVMIDVYVPNNNNAHQTLRFHAHGIELHVIPRQRDTNIELLLPLTLLRDARTLPHLQELCTVDQRNVVIEPTQLYLRHHASNDGGPLLTPDCPITYGQVNLDSGPIVVPIDTPLWEMREMLRIARGDYLTLPQEALDYLAPESKVTHPHMSMKVANRGLVAFTRDRNAGQLDRQQVMKPGRYFKQYGIDPTDQRAKDFSAMIAGAVTMETKLLSTREEYNWAYATGPESCMCKGSRSNNKEKFHKCEVDNEWVHPVEVFAHPESDLRLLVVADGGKVGARTWLNTKTKLYARIYGSNNMRGAETVLREWLDNESYALGHGWCEDQPLLRLDSDVGGIICPYIDPSNYGVEVQSNRLVIGGTCEANHETGHLNGHDANEPDWTCDCCDRGQSNDDYTYETIGGGVICEDCRDQAYTAVESVHTGDTLYVEDNERNSTTHVYAADHLPNTDESYVYCRSLSNYNLVELDSDYYDSNCVARMDDCVRTNDGTWVLDEDTGHYDLLYCEEQGYWTPKDQCCLLIDAEGNTLVEEKSGADLSGLVETTDFTAEDFGSDYEGLTVYADQEYIDANTDDGETDEDEAAA